MQALKGIVVFMGLMIVTLMVLIVYGMVQKAQNPDFSFFAGDGSPAAVTTGAGQMGTVKLGLGPGAAIIGTTIAGGKIALEIDRGGAPGAEEVIIIDAASGEITGRIETGN